MSKQAGPTTSRPFTRPFPPPRDFSSLSIRDLIEAREAYRVLMSNIETVVGTAIGRYRIHEDDWYAKHPPNTTPKHSQPSRPRTFESSVVRPWSWPCVIVMVSEWLPHDQLRANNIPAIPQYLYLSDGRTIPTCVVLATPDENPAPPTDPVGYASALLGGGYACERTAQGITRGGTFACLVEREGTYYALTNRHVAGPDGGGVDAIIRGNRVAIGSSDPRAADRMKMKEIFPSWPDEQTLVNIDAGLVKLDDITQWTSQVFGIGEIAEPFDATESSLSLDIIGCPVRAFGGASATLEGEIQALFARYKSLGGFDYVCDVLIGRRKRLEDSHPDRTPSSVETRPGDSGTLWFYDPPNNPPGDTSALYRELPPERGDRARRLRPIAMQWGGQRLAYADGTTAHHALATFISTVCRVLDVDIVHGYGIGHDEYWGKIGHFSIGYKACATVDAKQFPNLSLLMTNNQQNIGFDDKALSAGKAFRMGSGGFVPLADVPDYVWVRDQHGRPKEPEQHFADVDIVDIDGGPPLLDRCVKDDKNISATAWRDYFAGFAAKHVGPDEGALPFRVWQLWNEMVAALGNKDVVRFVAAAGTCAHYVGDASQPLHCSWLHHGKPPTTKVGKNEYPPRHGSAAYVAFHKTKPSQIHGTYEETMLEIQPDVALAGVDVDLKKRKPPPGDVLSGFAAAKIVIELMDASRKRLSPSQIIAADDPTLTPKPRATQLWNNQAVRAATIASLADSSYALARIWQGAWVAGGGDQIPKAQLVKLAEAKLSAVYSDKTFAPGYTLDELAATGTYEPGAAKPAKSAKPAKRPPARGAKHNQVAAPAHRARRRR